MGKIACVFPGQGSQAVGMGKSLHDSYEIARDTFVQIDNVAGQDLSTMCFQGAEADLKRTINTQPTILAASLAAWAAFQQQSGITPDYVAGHSLGEITALVAAGALSIADAVRLVQKRATLMENCDKGAMTAVLAMPKETLEIVCKDASTDEEIVVIANLNTRDQLVISGNPEAVARAGALVKERGGKAIPLPVGGAFHSPLMSPAAREFETALSQCTFKDASCPVVQNVDAEPKTSGDALKSTLAKQMESPVRWVEIVERLASLGVDTIIEIGPGKVLTGLIKKIDKNIQLINVSDSDSLKAAVDQLKQVAV